MDTSTPHGLHMRHTGEDGSQEDSPMMNVRSNGVSNRVFHASLTPEPNHVTKRESLKQLSVSAPAMRVSTLRSPNENSEFAPSSSKSRQKKFHRHFKSVPLEEKVLDYYSCALVADILLQGYLYITENYFAFYSNVFGYVTKVLIPVDAIVRITKERTAKIIPNAVGVFTRSEKHVFASLLSRDTTYKLMQKVWTYYSTEQEAKEKEVAETKKREALKEEGLRRSADDSSGESGSGNESAVEPSSYTPSPVGTPATDIQTGIIRHRPSIVHTAITNTNIQHTGEIGERKDEMRNGPSLLMLATGLLLLLFFSAALLLSRISNLQEKLAERPSLVESEHFYEELLLWQNKLHSTSAQEIHQYINNNLQQIIKVRESLEALSLLFLNNESPVVSDGRKTRESQH